MSPQGTDPRESANKVKDAREQGGLGAARDEAVAQGARQGAEKFAQSLGAGAVPGAAKAAGAIGEKIGRSAPAKFAGKAIVAGAAAMAAPGVIITLVILALVGGALVMVTGVLAGSAPTKLVPPHPTDTQISAMPAGWGDVVTNAQISTENSSIVVPWELIAGLAKAETNYGKSSPYDTVDRYPNRPTPPWIMQNAADLADAATGTGKYVEHGKGECSVAPPAPTIGTGQSQAAGPFLLTPSAVADLRNTTPSADPNDPCTAAEYVAQTLSQTAQQLVDNNTLPPLSGVTPDAAQAWWQQVITQANVVTDPKSVSGPCAGPPGTAADKVPVDQLISDIWTCVINQSPALNVVTDASTDSAGKVSFTVADRASGTATLVSEAQSVAWNFSRYGQTPCDKTSAGAAGIFPLDPTEAAKYHVADRCDKVSNIRAAAQAVVAGEQAPPAARRVALGQPYSPMIGGWANLPDALGKEAASFGLTGPASSWHPTAACDAVITAFLTKAAGPGSPFFALASAKSRPADSGVYTAWLFGVGQDPSKSAACKAPPPGALYTAMAEQAQTLADSLPDSVSTGPGQATSPAPVQTNPLLPVVPLLPTGPAIGGSTPVYTPKSAMLGVLAWFTTQTSTPVPPAVYGVNSVIDRLSTVHRSIAKGPDSGFTVTVPVTPYAQAATDWAWLYGGLVQPWDTFGKRVGSLISTLGAGLTSGLVGSASEQAQIVIAAARHWKGTMYAWDGGNEQGPTMGSGIDAGVLGFDCSGLVLYSYAKVGLHYPHQTNAMVAEMRAAHDQQIPSLAQAVPGDILFFGDASDYHHVAIFTGVQNGKPMMMEAQQSHIPLLEDGVWETPALIFRVLKDAAPTSGPIVGLDPTQASYARGIAAEAKRLVPGPNGDRAALISLMTAYTESTLHMYASVRIPESLALPHELVGNDNYSVGLFQQQHNPGVADWGPVAELMNVQKSTDLFVQRLMGVPGWATIDPGVAAQTVQVSAFPDRYSRNQSSATLWLQQIDSGKLAA